MLCPFLDLVLRVVLLVVLDPSFPRVEVGVGFSMLRKALELRVLIGSLSLWVLGDTLESLEKDRSLILPSFSF